MRQDITHIIFDTETTGLSFNNGDRVVEIACIETINYLPTGREFHVYINPERDMPYNAYKVHGLSAAFLKDKPKFRNISKEFLEFIGNHTLVAHNAPFDMGFINGELQKCGMSALTNKVIDTVLLARKQLPSGSKVGLDVLCNRFKISLAEREKHSAIVDTRLLAKVFLELNEGKHLKLDLAEAVDTSSHLYQLQEALNDIAKLPVLSPRNIGSPSEKDLAHHDDFISKKIKSPLWLEKITFRKPGF